MTTARFGSATWRRLLLATITALIALLAVSAGAPERANAFIDPNVVLPSHTGWVYVKQGMCGVVANADGTPCYSFPAWRWSGSRWTSQSIQGGTQVYVYPYTGSWSWIWTQHTGWLAIQRSSLDTGYHCSGYACPVF